MAYPVPRPTPLQPRQSGLLGLGGNFLGDALNVIGTGLLGLGSGRDDWGLLAMQGLQNRQQDRLANTRQAEQDYQNRQLFDFQVKKHQDEQAQAVREQQKLAQIRSGLDPSQQKLFDLDPQTFASKYIAQAFPDTTGGGWKIERIREGGEDVTYRINPATGDRQEIGRGPAWAPQQPNTPEAPSSVMEWNFFNNLSPEDQKKFLTMKRANDWQNLGGNVTLPDPLNPAGAPVAVMPKTLPPQDTPEVRGDQASAVATAQAAAEAAALEDKKRREASTTLSVLDGVEDLIDKATGSAAGAAVDEVAGFFGKATEGATATGQLKVLEAKLMSTMPRMEGPQSNLDVELYRQAAGKIGDPKVPREIKKAAVETIRQLQAKYPSAAQAQPAATPNVIKYDAQGNRIQ